VFKIIKAAISRLLSFFASNALFISTYALLLALPDIRRNPLSYDFWLLYSLPCSVLQATLFCVVGSILERAFGDRFGRLFKKIWHFACHILLYVLAFVDLYLLMAFGLGITQEALLLVLQTNSREASEFAFGSFTDGTFWLALLLFLIAAMAECLLFYFKKPKGRAVALALIAFSVMGVRSFVDAVRVFSKSGYEAFQTAVDSSIDEVSVVKLYCAATILNETLAVGGEIDKHIDDTRVRSTTDYKGNIVLIIGESHNKWHSSLYGYEKNTNPKMSSLGDNLAVFRNVVSPKNVTFKVFQEMFSVSSLDDSLAWNEATLFPAVFKSAGWNVVMCSNQFTDEHSHSNWGAEIVAFLNTEKTNKACFTTRNHSIFRYDGEMIDSFLVERSRFIDNEKPTLTIINLLGQHRVYSERFPADKVHFSVKDYANRDELSDRQKQFVADYDNACLYNDEQLYKICNAYKDEDAVVIYVSDHGDEVYDYRARRGRVYDLRKHAPYSYLFQLGVPFFVYVTDAYRENHPEIAKNIFRSIKRRFMTDDLCHMLFCIGEVDTEWFSPARCLVHKDYNKKRKRVLMDGDDYDEMASIKP